jgi:hypothetical protein
MVFGPESRVVDGLHQDELAFWQGLL